METGARPAKDSQMENHSGPDRQVAGLRPERFRSRPERKPERKSERKPERRPEPFSSITSTIFHPDMFFAYNNGITVTAEKCELDDNGNITRITNLQIVNGGQTTATLFHARSKGLSTLDGVFVQTKLSILDDEKDDEVIPNISRFAKFHVNPETFAGYRLISLHSAAYRWESPDIALHRWIHQISKYFFCSYKITKFIKYLMF